MSISEELVAENIELRKEVARLNERIEIIHERSVDEWVSAKKFMSQLYNCIAQQIEGEWKTTGDMCGWTPEQIALAEVVAFVTRQELYAKARQFDDGRD